MSRALRFVVLEVSIINFGSYLSIHVGYHGACAAVAVHKNVSKCAVETNDTCPRDMSSENEKSASQFLSAPRCGMQKSDSGKMPNR